jgi:hypothetical protein
LKRSQPQGAQRVERGPHLDAGAANGQTGGDDTPIRERPHSSAEIHITRSIFLGMHSAHQARIGVLDQSTKPYFIEK